MTRDGSVPRQVAARACQAVLDRGRALDGVLPELLEPLLDGRDRALARRLTHGVLRDWPALDRIIGQLVERPLARRQRVVHFLLAVALFELRDGREPAPAVIHSTVAAARGLEGGRLSGLVNAVLRGFQRRQSELQAALGDDPAVVHGYPGWLIERIRDDWSDRAGDILAAGNRAPPLWLRVNRRRLTRQAAAERLADAGFEVTAPAAFADALLMAGRAAVRELPGFADGDLSVQDGGAQLAADWLRLADGQRVLDACAAPGGKSAHILERADVALTALDLDPVRLERVDSGLKRLGLEAELLAADAGRPADWWDGRPFDRILVDAPCSATGVIRRHPDIRWLRRPDDIAQVVETQRRLLDALWPLLGPGGILVYATCSVLREENRQQAQAFLERHADARTIDNPPEPGRPDPPGRQLLPGDDGCDGFFYFAAQRVPA